MPTQGALVKCAVMKQTSAIHLFYCANSVTEAELQALGARFGADGLKTLSLPCSGKATIPYLLKAFEKGAEGVVLCACPASQCRHLEGNLRAAKRVEAVEGLLEEIDFGKDRVVVVTKEQGQIEKLLDSLQRLRAQLDEALTAGAQPVRAIPAGLHAGPRRENAA
jgi:coenzyme F420-reducing hydrogenase delta subunit